MALVDYYSTGDDGEDGFAGSRWSSMTFTASSSYTMTGVGLKLCKTGSPGTLTITLRAVDGSSPPKPTTTVLATGTYNGNSLGASPGAIVEIVFAVPYNVTNGTRYAIVMSGAAGGASIRYDSSGEYAGGNTAVSDDAGSSWTVFAGLDSLFETYATTPPVSISGTMAGTSALAATPSTLVIKHVTGVMGGISALSGAITISIVRHITGNIAGTSSLVGTVVALELHLSFAFPASKRTDVIALEWSDTTDTWGTDLVLQGAGGGRYLITAIAFSLDADTNGIIFLGS